MASPDGFTRTTLRVTPGDTSAYACIGQYGLQTTQPSKRGRFFIKLNVHDRDFRLSRATVTSRPNVGSYATREAALAAVPTARLVYEPPTRAPRPAREPDDEEDLEVARARAFFRARQERVLSSLGPENLSRRRMFRCSRKAREYKRVYLKKADAPFSHAEIENGRAEVKAARLARTHTHHRSAPAADVAEIETAA